MERQAREKKIFCYVFELGVLCVFARVIVLQGFATENSKYVWLVLWRPRMEP